MHAKFSNKNLQEYLAWDIQTWSEPLVYWQELISQIDAKQKLALELGANKGGLSLWLSRNGFECICSDYNSDLKNAKEHHSNSIGNISYQDLDASNLPFENHFDIIVFKSVLGGVIRNKPELLQKTFKSIYKALKPNGVLLFAENAKASILHQLARRYFVSWGKSWKYLSYREMENSLVMFNEYEIRSTGFFTAFVTNHKIKSIVYPFDKVVSKFFPKSNRYVCFGMAKKTNK